MPAPAYAADAAGHWFPESKLDKGFKPTGAGTAIPKGNLVRFAPATFTYATAAAGAAVPGDFAVTTKATTDTQADLELVTKGPVTVVTATILRRGMYVRPSATVAGQVDEISPDTATATGVGAIGKYMGTALSNSRDGSGAPATTPAGTVVIIDLNFGVSGGH